MKNNAIFIFFLSVILSANCLSQGLNHIFLLGYDTALFDTNVTSAKARLLFNSNSLTIAPESRKMAFDGTQANISDQNGNLLMSSNGCWIANATGDTMFNGSGLNPGTFTDDWNDAISGLPIPHGNIFLPFPGDSTKYILFHQTGNYNANLISTELYYSLIDMTLDSGKGGVALKNQVLMQKKLSWGIAACKHANGRDWWIVVLKDSSFNVKELLLTPQGISSITTLALDSMGPIPDLNATQITFSPDGNKLAFTYGYGGPNSYHDVRIYNFDRCSGHFSALGFIPFYNDNSTGFGLAFSSNSKYLYHCSFHSVYQLNTDTTDIAGSIDTVAINDGYYSPYPPFQTNFLYMYRAANGLIYISCGNGVIDFHCINSPDSEGMACNVQLHSIHLPCFSFRSNVNHPNYYLSPVIGSTCDSLVHVGVYELSNHDFHFSISPNPSNGNIKIIYLMPQNKGGVFEIFDVMGKKVYSMQLPPWSTLQNISLPKLADGVYNAVITSNRARVSKKLVVMTEK